MPKRGKISVELLDTSAQLEKIILSTIRESFFATLKKASNQIENGFSGLVYNAVYNCVEMEQVRGGSLRHELGLPSSQSGIVSEQIARTVSESVFVNVQKPKGKNSGGLIVNIQPTNFANVLSISGSTVEYFSKKNKENVTLEWLDWLLTKGDTIIVGKFHFEPTAGRGRTGGGRMEKGGTWKINSQFSGTVSDNFISRALESKSIRGKMTEIIEKSIKKNWN